MDSQNNMTSMTHQMAEPSSVSVSLDLTTDNFPQEISWDLKNENGNIIEQGGNYTEELTLYNYDWILDYGCYTFNLYDSYGDGVNGSLYIINEDGDLGTDGVVKLIDLSNGVIWEGINYGSGITIPFEVQPGLDLEEGMEDVIKIYPNPSKDYTNVTLNLSGDDQKLNP